MILVERLSVLDCQLEVVSQHLHGSPSRSLSRFEILRAQDDLLKQQVIFGVKVQALC